MALPRFLFGVLLFLIASGTLSFQSAAVVHHHRHKRWHNNRYRHAHYRSASLAGGSNGRGRDNPIILQADSGIGVGIDLGTTNSAIAYLDDDTNKPRIIAIPHNGHTLPSIVAYGDDDAILLSTNDYEAFFSKAIVGKEALEWEQQQQQRLQHQTSAYRHVKRILGASAPFLSKETKEVVPHLVIPKDNGDDSSNRGKYKKKKKAKLPTLERLIQAARDDPAMLYPLWGSTATTPSQQTLVSPETISSCILHKLLIAAREHTGRPISRAVIGVPAYFNDAQREATIRAANACGIDKIKLLREPEAAALAYGIQKDTDEQEELVLVFDLGGGTYDVSVLLVAKGLTEIVCTAGNAQLGGTNFDAKIAKYLQQQSGLGKTISVEAADMILRSAERVRIYLSNNKIAQLALPSTEEGWLRLSDPATVILTKDAAVPELESSHVELQLSRREMEKLCAFEFQELLRPIREVAIMAGALLPGDARPGASDVAMEMEAAFIDAENFYAEEEEDGEDISDDLQDVLQAAEATLDLQLAKKAQQKGRKKAREVAKQERKYRAESRKVQETAQAVENIKVRTDGISGRPLSRIVLVGGATRMPAIGRLLASLTGVVPQRTVDPDEAVALGCAVHVGVLDGKEELGVVLSPMQAALLRAAVEKERRDGGLGLDNFDDEDDFSEVEIL